MVCTENGQPFADQIGQPAGPNSRVTQTKDDCMPLNNLIDVHNHTVMSGHAYSTLSEMCRAAAARGIRYYGVTEHAPGMPGSCQAIYFSNFKVVDREHFGVHLMLGAEVNILNRSGDLDLPPQILAMLDLMIVSMHTPTYHDERSQSACTEATLAALRCPWTNILGHPDDSQFPLDYDAVIREAAEQGVVIEMNNASFSPWSYRRNGRKNARIFLERCRHYGVPVIMNSDAHFESKTGHVEFAETVLAENHFPEALVLNDKPEQFLSIINRRRAKWGGDPITFSD